MTLSLGIEPRPGSQGCLVVINRVSHLCDPGSALARVVCGLSFSRSQPDSEGFSPGTPVFLPPQNRLAVNYIWLGLRCSEITHGSYGGSRGRLCMHSIRSGWAGWSWKALVGSGQLSAHLNLHLHLHWWEANALTMHCTILAPRNGFVSWLSQR